MIARAHVFVLVVGMSLGLSSCPADIVVPTIDDDALQPPDPPSDPNDFNVLPPPPPPPPPPPACEDDAAEPNDEQPQATALLGTPADAQICDGNADWYSASAGNNCVVRFEVTTNAEDFARGADVNAVLVDAQGAVLATGGTLEQTDVGRGQTTRSGDVFLRVQAPANVDVAYVVSLDVSCGNLSCPTDDDLEDDDTIVSATTVSEGVTYDAIACGADADVYALVPRVGCATQVRVLFADENNVASDDIDVELQDASGARLQRSAGTSSNEEIITGVAAPSFVKVFVFNGQGTSPGNNYQLVANEFCSEDYSCPSDDVFEPNDERGAARELLRDAEVAARTCGANEDFYTIDTGGCSLQVDVLFRDADGDIDVQALKPDGTVLQSSSGSADNERLTVNNESRVVVRVFGFQDQENGYVLRTTSTCP
jgi:hypothetical protein